MSDVDEIDYLEDSGPGVKELPHTPPPALPAGAEPPPQTVPGWDQETIETFLQGTGAGIHMLIGQSERDWLMTEADLKRIAPPLTRICNRWEPALRLSPVADPLLVAHGFALYGWRSALERRRALRDAEEELGPTEQVGYEHGPPAEEPVDQEQVEPEGLQPEDIEAQPYFPESRRAA